MEQKKKKYEKPEIWELSEIARDCISDGICCDGVSII